MNKQINLKLLLCIFFVLCLSFCAISCSNNNKNSEQGSSSSESQSESVKESESQSESENKESEPTVSYVSVSGIMGTGYRIEGLNTKVEKGETVEFSLNVSQNYLLSSPVVKVNGNTLTSQDGKYSVTANENLQITVENLVKYETVENSPISLNGTVSTSIISHPASSLTNVIPTNYQKASLKNVGLSEFLSLVFFVKAEGIDKWILIKNKDGDDLYSNAIRNQDDSGWIADDVWHKVEVKKEEAIYQLYVDGVKVEKYDESAVNATALSSLSEFSFLFNENANYYFSELFGAKNPDFVESNEFTVTVNAGNLTVEGELTAKKGDDVTFTVTADEGFLLTATNAETVSVDGLVYTFRVPSIQSNVTVTITQEVDLEDVLTTELWTKKGYDGRFINTANGYSTSKVYIGSKSTYTGAPLSYVYLNAKYEEIRFSIYSVDSQWFELGIVDEESWDLTASNKAVWTELSLRKEGEIFQLYVNGTKANGSLKVGGNLNEWQLKLASSGTFYLSEVLGKIDVNYVPPKSHTVTVISNGLTVSGELTVEEGKDAIFTVSAPEGYTLSADNAELVSSKGLIYTFKIPNLLEDVTVTITSTKLVDTIIANSPWTKEPAVGDVIFTDGGYTISNLYVGSNANYKGAPLVDFLLTGDYKELRFAIYSVDGSWFEIGSTGENTWDLLVGNKKGWTEIKLVNEGKGVFQLYEDGILSDGSVAVGGNLNELQMRIGTSGTFYITELLAKQDPNYVPPKEYTVTVNADGLEVDGKLTVQEGANVTFTVTANEGYILLADNAKLLSINGLVYTYKVDDLVEDVTVTITATENPYTTILSSPWTKEPSVGNLFNLEGYYTVSNQYLGNNSNYYGAPLANLVLLNYYEEIHFAVYSASGNWYEIGSTEENTWDILVGNESAWTEIVLINDGNGLFKLYKNGKWTNESIAVGGNLNELQMRIASSGTFYFSEVIAKLNPELAPKLYTVTVLADGLAVEGNLTAEEGTDVTFSVTANEGYTLSADNAELLSVEGSVYTFAVKNISSNVTVTVTASEIKPTTIVVAQNPWVKAGSESDFIYTEKGYSYSTSFTGSNNTYVGDNLINLTLTNNYKEIRFAIYSADGSWWEIGFASSSEWNVAVSNKASWIEVRLVNDGNGNFKVYRDDEDRNASIAVGSNLNVLRMRFGTSGTFYLSEILGVVENQPSESIYAQVAQNPFGLTGEETTDDLGSEYSSVTTVSSTKWTSSGYKFVEVDVNNYSELRFYVKSNNWFELYSADKTLKFCASMFESWTEVKLVKGESTWSVYINGVEKGTIVLTNLKDDFFVQLGDSTVSLSELLGIPDTIGA